jgi:PhzF family phenazine biosynthesis protein
MKKTIRWNLDMKQYIVDAFTNKIFSGNPAAVCVMDAWPDEKWMMQLAAENNLSETAFIVKEDGGYHLRWFTPGTEVELCGHATLASAFVMLNYYEKGSDQIEFNTLSGTLTVTRKGTLYELDFPTYDLKEIPVTSAMEEAFGVRPVKAVLGLDLVCVFENEDIVRNMAPDQNLLMKIEGRIQNATARGREMDCVSRSFCPKLAIPEDPVCGSAHCQIADYWSKELVKDDIIAYQASKRGGTLHCHLSHNGRIQISGEAVLFAVAEIPDTVSCKTLEDMDRAIENFKMNKVSAPIDL